MALSLYKKLILNPIKKVVTPGEYKKRLYDEKRQRQKKEKQKVEVSVRTQEDSFEESISQIETAKINLIKTLYECLGEDFGEHEAVVAYKNYAYDYIIAYNDTEGGSNEFVTFDSTTQFSQAELEAMSAEPGDTGLSDGMLNFICQYETGHPFGYTMTSKDLNGYDLGDAGGHKTYGYGILYHPVTQKFMDTIKSSWTKEELENLFKIHAKKTSEKIDSWAAKNNITLLQCQKDAIASGCYNFGPGFLNKSVCKIIARNPMDPTIRNVWAHLSDAQGRKYPGLIKRRQAEAAWYFGGQ